MISTLVLLDFDNTLFRTREFWRERLFPAYLSAFGITAVDMERVFDASTTGSIDYFLPARFFEELSVVVPETQMQRARDFFNKIVFAPESADYITPSAQTCIANIKSQGGMPFLMSYGDKAFKLKWFKSLGIEAWFGTEHICVTAQPKEKVIETMPAATRVIVVDDQKDILLRMLKQVTLRGCETQGFLYDPQGLENLPEVTTIQSLAEINIL